MFRGTSVLAWLSMCTLRPRIRLPSNGDWKTARRGLTWVGNTGEEIKPGTRCDGTPAETGTGARNLPRPQSVRRAPHPAWGVCWAWATLCVLDATAPLPHEPAGGASGMSLLPWRRGRLRPMGKDPDSSLRMRDRRCSSARTSGTDLLLSLAHFTNRIADLFLLIMVRVIPVFATQNHCARETRMAELAVGTFPSMSRHESSLFQIGDQLVDLSRHEVSDGRSSRLTAGRQCSSLPIGMQFPGTFCRHVGELAVVQVVSDDGQAGASTGGRRHAFREIHVERRETPNSIKGH